MERFKADLSTQRIKPVLFEEVSDPWALTNTANRAWDQARRELDYPLIQVRGVVPMALERELIREVEGSGPFAVVARIPFNIDREPAAIYYVQAEVNGRPGYKFADDDLNISHRQALARASEKMNRGFKILPDGYTVRSMIPDSSGSRMQATNDKHFFMDTPELAKVLVETHKACFEYPHDSNQQDVYEVEKTLRNNPIVLAFDVRDNVVAVGYIEKDKRFTLGNGLTLVEPTYWTLPTHRHAGASYHLRQAAKDLYDQEGNIICFGESVRSTSFVLILASGYELAGTDDLAITGNLGDAYTAIGPANPGVGYIPMGASFHTSSNIRVNPENRFVLNGVVK